jgi:hypothetical protein
LKKKRPAFWQAALLGNETTEKLIDSLFGHFGALGCPLACLKSGIGLIDDVEGPLTLDDLAISVTTFGGSERRENFHETCG